jgi:hypothetical protein
MTRNGLFSSLVGIFLVVHIHIIPMDDKILLVSSASNVRHRIALGLLGAIIHVNRCTPGSSAYSFGLSATSQQYFSLRTNQSPAISQQYFSLTTNQHQPSATSQTNRLHVLESSSGARTNYMLIVTAMLNRSSARFCMIHIKDLQIQIWMHNLDGGAKWMLVETICFTGCTFSVNDT